MTLMKDVQIKWVAFNSSECLLAYVTPLLFGCASKFDHRNHYAPNLGNAGGEESEVNFILAEKYQYKYYRNFKYHSDIEECVCIGWRVVILLKKLPELSAVSYLLTTSFHI